MQTILYPLRDIKSANIFLDGDMNAKLGDIGLAQHTTAAGGGGGGCGGNVSSINYGNGPWNGVPEVFRASLGATTAGTSSSSGQGGQGDQGGQGGQGQGRGGSEAVGTWQYLAPEYKSFGTSSDRTDVYAFGLTLLQLATGAERPKEVLHRCQVGRHKRCPATGEGRWESK